MSMSMRILALDIDDCIFPSNQTYFGMTDDNLLLLEINLKRIVLMLNKYDMKVFITSSWYSILKLKDNELLYDKELIYLTDKPYYQEEYSAFKLIKKYLEAYIVGLSCGSRDRDIKELLKNKNQVIAFDDMDLSHISDDNYLYVYVHGYVDNSISYKIKLFMKGK